MLTREQLGSLIEYYPEHGDFFWKERGREWFSTNHAKNAWNARFANGMAGSVSRRGYIHISINGKFYQAHRLAWLLVHGEDAPEDIDHIDGDPTNNRIANLRAVSHAENGRNRRTNSNNLSGVNGVGWNARFGKWQARIKVNGRSKSLGYFDDLNAAADARKSAEREFGYHENHGRAA